MFDIKTKLLLRKINKQLAIFISIVFNAKDIADNLKSL